MSIFNGLLLILLLSNSVSLESVKETTTAKDEELTPNRDRGSTPGVTSRFFGLGNILGSLFGSNRGSQDSNIFRPAVAVQRPFDRQEGWNPGFNDHGRYPNQGGIQGNPGMYPIQGGFQNFDQGRNPNQGQGELPIQGVFGGSQGQGGNFGLQQYPEQGLNQDQSQRPIQGGFGNNQGQGGNFGVQQYPDQGINNDQSQPPIQGGFGNNQGQGGDFGSQQYPAQGVNQGQGQFPNQGIGFMNPDELPNQVNLQDQGTIYDPVDQWDNQGPSRGNQGQYPGQGQFGDQNGGQWPNQGPNQMQSQGFLRPTQRPSWLDIGQGNYPQPGQNNAGVNNPSQSFPNQGTQTDDFSPVDFDNDGLNRQGTVDDIPASVGGGGGEFDSNNISTTTGSPSGIVNDNQSSLSSDPVLTQCVQDCTSTTEYNPVCGSNNITYFNGGKFTCARNCGLDIYVLRKGRCPGDIRRGLKD